MKERHGQRPLYKDGSYDSQWVIIDYGNVMVHILTPEKRDYYALEELWGDAPEIALQEQALTPALRPRAKKAALKKVPTKKPTTKRAVKHK